MEIGGAYSAKGYGLCGQGARNKKRLRAGLGCPVVAVQALAHFLARLEKRDALLIDRHMRAGARIAAVPGGAMLHRQRTESPRPNPVAPRHTRTHPRQH